MASSTRRDLFLQVSANTDAFTAAMKAGRSVLNEFGSAANDTTDEIQKAFQKLGGANVATSAKALESSYTKAFAAIRANAAQVADAPSGNAAFQVLNTASATNAATAATAQAAGLRLVADAAARAAVATEGDATANRVYAAAAEAAAVGAEQQAAALRAQAGVLASVEGELRAAGVASVDVADKVTSGHNRMGASGLILQHVVRSTSDSFAAGLPPTTIFAEQIGRLGEAAALSGGSLGGLGAFLGGPWGIALTAGVAVLGPLVVKLFEAHDAAELAKVGANGLTEAQGVLGNIFDLTSGKLEHQNELLRLNARLTAANLRADSIAKSASSTATFASAGSAGLVNSIFGSARLLGGLASLNPGEVAAGQSAIDGNPAVRLLALRARNANKITDETQRTAAFEHLLRNTEATNFDGSGIDKTKFQQAIVDQATSRLDRSAAAAIDSSLDSGTLDKSLRNDPKEKKPKKPKVDHSEEREANRDRAYQAQLGQAQDRLAKAQLSLADTAENRYAVEVDELHAAKVQRDLEIDDQVRAKKLTLAEADKLKSLNAATEIADRELATRKEAVAILDRQLENDRAELNNSIALLQLQSDQATTAKERRRLALQILAQEEKLARDAAIKDVASEDPDTQARGEASLRQIDAEHPLKEQAAKDRTADPLEAYGKRISDATKDMNSAFKSVAADGLQSLEDGFVGVISGTESVASAFKKMAASIIADLARIAVEKLIVNALGSSFFGFSKGGEVPAFAGGGQVFGAGSGTSDSILARLSNGEFVVHADATRRYLPLLHAINDNALPGYADGGLVGSPAIFQPRLPDPATLGTSAGGAQQITLRVTLSDDLHATIDQRAANVSIEVVKGSAGALIDAATTNTFNKLNRTAL